MNIQYCIDKISGVLPALETYHTDVNYSRLFVFSYACNSFFRCELEAGPTM